jgi:lysophospholipase
LRIDAILLPDQAYWFPAVMRRISLTTALVLAAAGLCHPATDSNADFSIQYPAGLAARFKAPIGIEWNYFQNADGARVRWSHVPAAVPDKKGTVVLMHGYSEFAEKYFEVMRDLTAHGYDVWQMDWRGYGGSDRYLREREKAHSLGTSHDTHDLDQFVRTVVKQVPGKPLILIAHSMGAQLAVRYLHDYPRTFQAVVLSSPFLSLATTANRGMPDWLVGSIIWSTNSFGFSESWAMGNGPWKDKPIEKMSHDPVRAELQRQWNRANPALRIGGVTNGWIKEYVSGLDVMKQPGYYGDIKLPVLLGSASEDVLTKPDVHAQACSQMPNCRLLRLDHAWHELFMESDNIRSPWLNSIYSFLDGVKPEQGTPVAGAR